MGRETKKQMAPMQEESNGLLDSAKVFLIEALRNHGAKKNGFAILHAVTAAELVLKARLARVHPALVREDIDSKDISRRRTVGLTALPQRLANLGLALDPQGAKMIGRFAEWRNSIVHHLPQHDERLARSQVPTLLNFIAEYLDHELDVPLRGFLPRDLYRTANDTLEKWKRIAARAAERAQSEGRVLGEACPDCGVYGVLSVRNGQLVYCHLCDATNCRCASCSQCGRETLASASGHDEDIYCHACTEAAGDLWASMQEDIRRGK